MALHSNKTHVLVAIALLMALLAAVVSAGRADLPMEDNTLCTESYCSKHDTGSCKFVGLFVYCCCGPVHSTGSNDVHKLGH
ncbi:hypothetical protein HU200_002600 [Digitaria exilis]|uniref:Uncharacterized protein n=1 Tax=Digitaria exilis TaxID=1010633 RepID=A0A835KJM4_9POAL|nr:hypothetical protein HU200_016788 [Digitaria exilis]KAF8779472.1 hypothetical protein HU200_002600 [Digitaria exilis]